MYTFLKLNKIVIVFNFLFKILLLLLLLLILLLLLFIIIIILFHKKITIGKVANPVGKL